MGRSRRAVSGLLSGSVTLGTDSRVTCIDTDQRAARYFADSDLVAAELAAGDAGIEHEITFLRADYTKPLLLVGGAFDLLISLYAGPVWDNCGQYLRPGGLLLANTSHGDASIAALDPALELVAAVQHRDGRYRLDTQDLARYRVARKPEDLDPDRIRARGRGISYTHSAFAYLFQKR